MQVRNKDNSHIPASSKPCSCSIITQKPSDHVNSTCHPYDNLDLSLVCKELSDETSFNLEPDLSLYEMRVALKCLPATLLGEI